MLRNVVMIAAHLFEAFVQARWSGFHLARQLALFPATDLQWGGSVTEQRDPFVSSFGPSLLLNPQSHFCALGYACQTARSKYNSDTMTLLNFFLIVLTEYS